MVTLRGGWRARLALGSIGVLSAMALTAHPAAAQILTYGFTDLRSDFTAGAPGTGTLNIMAVSASTGDVTRLVPTTQSALFVQDFVSGPDPANVVLSLGLTGITASSAAAAGTFTITDINGDTLTGNVTGLVAPLGGNAALVGTLSNVLLNGSGNGIFEGTSGSFPMSFAGIATPPFSGATNYLISIPAWFDQGSFTGASTQIQAQIVPEPAGLALLALGALAVGRRRAA
ncbi:MAG TPA: PEP-CTERM sorting domain-containing protein [Phycisphaerae bacterium]|jgi:hypothetical protein